MIFMGAVSLRRVLYTSCSPGDAAQLRSSTCALQHHLHPKNEYQQDSRARKYSPFCCHRKRSVRCGDSPFPASAVAKGITHYTLRAKWCANRVPLAPIGNPEPKGLHPSGHLQFSSHGGTQTVKMQFASVRRKYKRKHLRHDRECANLPFAADNLKLIWCNFKLSASAAAEKSILQRKI